MGNSEQVHGMLQILYGLQVLADWAVTEHRAWLTDIYADVVAQAT